MTLRQQLSQFIIQAAPYAFALLLALVAWLGKKASAWLTAHTKLMDNALVVAFLGRLNVAATQAVQAVEQTTVAALKAKTGQSLTVADAVVAKDAAVALIKQNLGGPAGVAKVQEILGVPDIETYLASVVEAKVGELKSGTSASPPPPTGSLKAA